MNYYHKPENVERYRSAMKDYDNSTVLRMLQEVLPYGSSLLELGMGTGADLLELSKNYQVIGSDYSPIFLSDFRCDHPEIPVCELNAIDFQLDQRFDCIYSNKVLHHLSVEELSQSLKTQAHHLCKNGILFFTIWFGTFREEKFEDGLLETYYTEKDLEELVPADLSIVKMLRYTEIAPEDSLAVVLKKNIR